MKNLIIIRNGDRIICEGDTLEELEQAYERFVAIKNLPKFSAIERCHLESEDGKLCILDTRDNPDAAKSYYHVGFEDVGFEDKHAA
jgi:hypothetical protein